MNFKFVEIDGVAPVDGRLPVSGAPIVPPGLTPAGDFIRGGTTQTANKHYIVPTGKIVRVTLVKAAAQGSVSGTAVSLFHAPQGEATIEENLVFVEGLIVSGNSAQFNTNYESPQGDGTATILLRVEQLSGGTYRVYAEWEGYHD